jgi:opacity protein-like surface antigen
MPRLTALVLLAASACVPFAAAQAPAAQAPAAACAEPEHRQFDFWLGHWSVAVPGGKLASDSVIEPILGGCGISESFTGARGATSRSLNLYNRSLGAWEQFWIDSQGNRLQLRGGWRDGAMVMQTPEPVASGSSRRDRMTWTPNADGTVRQLWEVSADAGATWAVSFDGLYTRRDDAAVAP